MFYYLQSSTVKLVVGRDKTHFLNGTIDDVCNKSALNNNRNTSKKSHFLTVSKQSSFLLLEKFMETVILLLKLHILLLSSTNRQLTLWGVRVPGSEIVDYMKLAGLTRPIHKGLVRAHFNMEDTSGSVILDQAGNGFHGNLVGSPVFVPVRGKIATYNKSRLKLKTKETILCIKLSSYKNTGRAFYDIFVKDVGKLKFTSTGYFSCNIDSEVYKFIWCFRHLPYLLSPGVKP